MPVLHEGKEAPILPEEMNPDDTDTFFLCWTKKLNGATLSSDVWELPDNFTLDSSQSNIPVIEDGVTYNDCNAATISTTEESGKFLITNRATFSDGRVVARSFYIVLDSKL
jgi:hypothetical protein